MKNYFGFFNYNLFTFLMSSYSLFLKYHIQTHLIKLGFYLEHTLAMRFHCAENPNKADSAC